MFNKVPPCGPCGFVTIIPENYEVVSVIYEYILVMIDGNGSIKLDGIKDALELSGVDVTPGNINKIMLYLTQMLKSSRERMKNG